MLAKDLIKHLEDLIKAHAPHVADHGELAIYVDRFVPKDETNDNNDWEYAGYDYEIRFDAVPELGAYVISSMSE